jgi:hypothetical protein
MGATSPAHLITLIISGEGYKLCHVRHKQFNVLLRSAVILLFFPSFTHEVSGWTITHCLLSATHNSVLYHELSSQTDVFRLSKYFLQNFISIFWKMARRRLFSFSRQTC